MARRRTRVPHRPRRAKTTTTAATRADEDQVPGAVVGQQLLQGEEDDRSDDGAFDGAQPADDHGEDHEGAPVETEAGLGLHPQQVEVDDRAGDPGAEGGDDVDPELGAEDVHPQTPGARLVVSDGRQGQAAPRAQQEVDQGDGAHRHRQGQPEDHGFAGGALDLARRCSCSRRSRRPAS